MTEQRRQVQLVDPNDNVVTALVDIAPGTEVAVGGIHVTAKERIPFGHKMAVRDIPRGAPVVKYGEAIGVAAQDIVPGEHVHSHNLITERGIRRQGGSNEL